MWIKETKLYKYFLFLLEFVIFIDFWVILSICLWGGFDYKLIKIFRTYPEAHSLKGPLFVLVLLLGIWRLLERKNLRRNVFNIFRNPYYYLISFITVYCAITIPVVLQPYYQFQIDLANDFALHQNAIFNTTI